MVDTISAPKDDRCAIEGCNRPFSEHHSGGADYTHRFVNVKQFADAFPRPADPLRDIRKMTEEEKNRATEVERQFAPSAAPRPRLTPSVTKEKPIMNEPEKKQNVGTHPQVRDTRPCAICGKPKTNHRGSIGHKYDPMTTAAAAARERRQADQPWTQKPAAKPATDRIDEKLKRVMDLAQKKIELEGQLSEVTVELRELLA